LGTVVNGLYTYEGFLAAPISNFPTVSAPPKVLAMRVPISGTCIYEIADAPLGVFPNATLNIVDDLGATITGTVTNNADCSVLPVDLLSFKAEKKGEKGLIKWETLNEKSIDAFIVERSSDGYNFETLALEKPKATRAEKREYYEVTDERPALGINYYRLQSKGFGKDVKYSKIVSVDFGLGLKAKAYPNPVSAELNIELDIDQGIKGEVVVDIFDTFGKQVLSKKVNAEGRRLNVNVPTDNLASGNYIIRVKNGSFAWQYKINKQ
jgi:hypothetical protein